MFYGMQSMEWTLMHWIILNEIFGNKLYLACNYLNEPFWGMQSLEWSILWHAVIRMKGSTFNHVAWNRWNVFFPSRIMHWIMAWNDQNVSVIHLHETIVRKCNRLNYVICNHLKEHDTECLGQRETHWIIWHEITGIKGSISNNMV